MHFTILQLAVLAALGLVAGVFGGMLGVGGSIILIPGMHFMLRQSQHLYQAAAMVVNVFVAAPSAWGHYRKGVVIPRVIRWLVPSSAVAVLLGVWASNHPVFRNEGTLYLGRIFAVFLVYVIAYNIFRLTLARDRLPQMDAARINAMPRWRISLVGVLMGFTAGLLGIGGGALAVPMQQIILKMPLKNAIGNSACTIVFSALVGAIVKNWTLGSQGLYVSQSLIIAATLIPSAFIGGWLGSVLTHVLPRTPVRVLFLLMLVVAAWKMWNVKTPGRKQADPARPSAVQAATPQPASPTTAPAP
ncbi:MAG: hypothetical protein BIFFINMI_02528 [Phycisphaerae bacterium]|nr:hypothetical protein [Phycisphaerae bacterium]